MSHYWTVHLGRLDRLNEGSSYAFPTEQAALYFALNHKRRAVEHARQEATADPDRDIRVEAPDGTTTAIPLIAGEFWKRDFEAESKLPEPQRKQAQEQAMRHVAAEVAKLRQEMAA